MIPAASIDRTMYDAARAYAAVYHVPQPGYLRIIGADRGDFIQRQTTNDVRNLTAAQSVVTVLTDPTAKILDVWRLVEEPGGEAIGVVTLPGRGATTAQYLQGRIFFMDKVTVHDASAEIVSLAVFGPHAAAVLAGIGLDAPEPGAGIAAEIAGQAVRVISEEGLTGQGVLIVAPAAVADALRDPLAAAGGVPVTPEVFDVLRVEAGLPGPVTELAGDYTPLEMNLDAAISGTKGCYTGQEIIARQITYDKVTRRLVGLRLETPVAVGASVTVEGRRAGVVTSVVQSPRLGWIALGVIKRPHHVPDTTVEVVLEDGPAVSGVTAALPFEA